MSAAILERIHLNLASYFASGTSLSNLEWLGPIKRKFPIVRESTLIVMYSALHLLEIPATNLNLNYRRYYYIHGGNPEFKA